MSTDVRIDCIGKVKSGSEGSRNTPRQRSLDES